jgi:hypothetical protein
MDDGTHADASKAEAVPTSKLKLKSGVRQASLQELAQQFLARGKF